MQQRRGDGRHVQLHVREHVCDFQGVGKERLAGFSFLRAMLLRGKLIRAAQQLHIIGGAILAQLRRQFGESRVHCAGGPVEAEEGFTGRRHALFYFTGRLNVPLGFLSVLS